MAVYFPVDSGELVEVQVSCYLDAQRDRPVNGYIIGGGSHELNRSLELGAEVAYERARQNRPHRGNQCFTLAVEIKRQSRGADLNGESGGLAFALACFAEIGQVNFGCPVAATGRIAGIKDGGRVSSIQALPEKLEGLLERLEPGSKIFYPEANAYDLPAEFRDRFQEKNISVYKVESVQQALEVLLGDTAKMVPRKVLASSKWLVIATLSLIVLAGLLTGRCFFETKQSDLPPQPIPAVSEPSKTSGSIRPVTPSAHLQNKATIESGPAPISQSDAPLTQEKQPQTEKPFSRGFE